MSTPIKYHTKEERCEALRLNSKKFRDKDPEAYRKYQREWAKNLSPEKKKDRNTKINRRKRGLTPAAYDAKLESQKGICLLCKQPFDLLTKGMSPSLDHNHETNVNRDFLHSNCNVAIGLLRDDPKICHLAAEYLERHSLEEEVWKRLAL